MSIQLPDPIDRYVQIANSGAAEAALECFAPDAIVRDEGQTYEGVAAIKKWMAATKKKYGHTIAPLELETAAPDARAAHHACDAHPAGAAHQLLCARSIHARRYACSPVAGSGWLPGDRFQRSPR